MKSKWKFNNEALKNYRIDSDGTIWRLGFFGKDNKFYSSKKIKKQHPKRYFLNGQMWSENQLRPHIIPDPEPIQLTRTTDLPF